MIRSKQSILLQEGGKKRVKQELSIVVLQYADLVDVIRPKEKVYSIIHDGKNVVDRSMIHQIMNDSQLLQEFKAFCEHEKTQENVLFLEDIKAYRQIKKVAKRIEKQEEMKKKYLLPNAVYLLNLPQQILENQVAQLFSGRVDDFDDIENIVMNMLSQDSLYRFLQSKQSPEQV